jgi:hypothetical protein
LLLRYLLAPAARWDAPRNLAALFFGIFVTLNFSGSYIHANNDLYPLLIIWLALMIHPDKQTPSTIGRDRMMPSNLSISSKRLGKS